MAPRSTNTWAQETLKPFDRPQSNVMISSAPAGTLPMGHHRTGSTTGAHGTMATVDNRRGVTMRGNNTSTDVPKLPERDSVQYFVLEQPPDYINVGGI